MVSHITIALDLSPGWHRAWHSPFLCLHGRRDPGWLGGITILKVMLLTGTRPGALLTPSTAQTSRSVGVLTATRIVHCFAYFLIHKLTNSGFLRTTQRTVPTRQLPPMQESIYYRFFKARCEREYKHTWHWKPPCWGTSLPQGYLCLCCFILAPSTWLKATSGSNWLFPSPAEAWPRKPSSPTSTALCPPEQGRLHTAICFRNWRMCPLSVRSHPEQTAINAPFVQALRPPPPSWCRQNLSCAGRLSPWWGFRVGSEKQKERDIERDEERVRRGTDVRRDTRGTGGYLVLKTGAFIFPPAHVRGQRVPYQG